MFFEWLTDLLHLNHLLKMEIALLLLCSQWLVYLFLPLGIIFLARR